MGELTKKQSYAIERTAEILGTLDETKLSFLRMWEDNLMVVSCAGSGKTNLCKGLIISRILSGEVEPRQVLYLSFSRDCIKDTKKSLAISLEEAGIDGMCEIKTVHSMFHGMLEKLGILSKAGRQVIGVTDEQKLMSRCRHLGSFYDMSPNDLLGLYECECEGLETKEHMMHRLFDVSNTDDKLKFERAMRVLDLYREHKGNKIGLSEFGLILLYLFSDEVDDFAKGFAHSLGLSESRDGLSKEERSAFLEIARRIVSRYKLVVIDEVQDLNVVQHKVLELLFGLNAGRKSDTKLVLVGDDDQCLIAGTKVVTDKGTKNIEDIEIGDKVLTGVGKGETDYRPVDKKSCKKVDTDIVVIKTKGGRTLRGTGNHIGFARIGEKMHKYATYLMYKSDAGFSIGAGTDEKLNVLLAQKKYDCAWVLQTCTTMEEALYWEYCYAQKYHLQIDSFIAGGRQRTVDVSDYDSFDMGNRLLEDFNLYFDYPYKVASCDSNKSRITLTMFDSNEKEDSGVYGSGVSVALTESDNARLGIMDIPNGFQVGNLNLSADTLDKGIDFYKLVCRDLRESTKDLVGFQKARLTDQTYVFTPLGSMLPGMLIPVGYNGHIVEDEIVSVERQHYVGFVYDLSVPDTRNFVADGIVVHNCIYEWRFSNVDLMRNAPLKYGLKVVYMDKSYRCADSIMELGSEILATGNDENRWAKVLKGRGEAGQCLRVSTRCNSLKDRVSVFSQFLCAYEFSKEITEETSVVLSRFRSSIVPICLALYEKENKAICEIDQNYDLDNFKSVYCLEGIMDNEKSYRDIKALCIAFVDRQPIQQTLNLLLPMMGPYLSNTQKQNIIDFAEEYHIGFVELSYLFAGDDTISRKKNRDQDEIRLLLKQCEFLTAKMYEIVKKGLQSLYRLCKNLQSVNRELDAYYFARYLVQLCVPKEDNKTLMKVGLYSDTERARYITEWMVARLDEQPNLKGNKDLLAGLRYILRLMQSFEDRYQLEDSILPSVIELTKNRVKRIRIKTVHASKGLQWDTVFFIDCDLTGVNNKKAKRLTKAVEGMNEEIRISYVGVTRARDRLLV